MAGLSERRRGRAIARLQHGYASGALSTQTLERRLDQVLRARTRMGLRNAVDDAGVPALLDRLRAQLRAGRRSSGLLLGLADERPAIIGRSSTCDVVLVNDSVSRRHAMIVRDGERYVLTDLESTNATYVNGRRVTQAEVLPGDVVQLGEVRIVL